MQFGPDEAKVRTAFFDFLGFLPHARQDDLEGGQSINVPQTLVNIDEKKWLREPWRDNYFYRYENGKKVSYFYSFEDATKTLVSKINNYSTCIEGNLDAYIRWLLFSGLDGTRRGGVNILKNATFDLEKINDMHPIVALRTLQQLGVLYNKKNGKNIACDISVWVFDICVYDVRMDPTRFLAEYPEVVKYIDTIIQFVNRNPAILNKDLIS